MNGVIGKSALVLLLAAAAGCDMSFDDPSQVKDLRILGLKTEPPEYVGPDYADLDRKLTFTALIADPLGEGAKGLHCLVRTCVLPLDYRCDEEESTLVLAEGPCTAGENAFELSIPMAAIRASRENDPTWRAIEAGIEQAVADGVPPEVAELGRSVYSGTAVWIEIVVTGGLYELRGLQPAIFSPVNPDGRVANSNPTIAGVRLYGQSSGTVSEIPFAPGESIRVDVLKTYDSSETYVLPAYDPPGSVETIDEIVTFAFYANAGSFSPSVTRDRAKNLFNVDPNEEPEPNELWSTWTAPGPGESPPGGVRFWFVLIDGRGGTDWMTMKGVPAAVQTGP